MLSSESLYSVRYHVHFFFLSHPHRRNLHSFPTRRSSDLTTLPTAYDVYPLDGRHDGGYYTVKDCVTIDGIITTIMATIQKIGRAVQQECRDRSRMPSSA